MNRLTVRSRGVFTVPMTSRKSVHIERNFARVSVNFRKNISRMARAWRAHAGLTVYPASQTLEPLAFDEFCRFDTSTFYRPINRSSLYNNKRAIFIES